MLAPLKEYFRGYYGKTYMALFSNDTIYFMIKEGLLTSLYADDTKELKIQLALGTFCIMRNASGTPLSLIPTMKAYKMFPKKDKAYNRTSCKQI